MTADDVTDAMAQAYALAIRQAGSISAVREAIAAAINASGCVLVQRESGVLQELEEALSAIPCDCPERRVERGDHLTFCFMFDAYAAYDRLKAMLAASDPREQALDRMAENAQELGLYGKEKGDE